MNKRIVIEKRGTFIAVTAMRPKPEPSAAALAKFPDFPPPKRLEREAYDTYLMLPAEVSLLIDDLQAALFGMLFDIDTSDTLPPETQRELDGWEPPSCSGTGPEGGAT